VIRHFRASPAARILYWLFVCVTVVVCIDLLRRYLILYMPRDWNYAHEFDALSDWKAARFFRLGISPYTQFGLSQLHQSNAGHPPTTPIWYLPMVDLPKGLVAELSNLALWFLLIPHVYICAKELDWPAPVAVTGLVVALVQSTSFFLYHYDVIQFSEPMAFLYLLSWLYLRKGQDARGGVCIGLAMTIKLFPGLMILVMVLSRRWRGVFSAIVVYGIIAAFMTYGYGIQSWSLFFAQQKPIAERWLGTLQNSSISGLVTQSLNPNCVGDAHPSLKASVICASVGLVMIAVGVWFSMWHMKRARAADWRAIDLPFTLFALLSVFLNPWVWEHYYFLVIHPLFVLTTQYWHIFWSAYRKWADRACSTSSLLLRWSAVAFAAAAIAFTLISLNREIWSIFYYRDLWQLSSVPLYHWRVHYSQALNFAPWIVSIVLCFVGLALTKRQQLPAR
jgi:hypothetical protein